MIKQGILGGFSGKVGSVVGSSWKGINVMKSMPISVANPRTAGQVAQRGRFGNVSELASILLTDVVKPCWDRFAIQQSGYNAFCAENIELFDARVPSPAGNFKIADGSMAKTDITVVSNPTGNNPLIAWADDSGEGMKLADDKAYVVIIQESGDYRRVLVGEGNERSEEEQMASVVHEDEGFDTVGDVHCYLAFRRADGTVVSQTAYRAE